MFIDQVSICSNFFAGGNQKEIWEQSFQIGPGEWSVVMRVSEALVNLMYMHQCKVFILYFISSLQPDQQA